MKLYYVASAAPGFRWQGTQVDAKKIGGKDGFELREVPTDKPGLLAFLNAKESEQHEQIGRLNWTRPLGGDPTVTGGSLDPLEQAELRAVEAAKPTTMPAQTTWTSTDIEDFILNRATVAQVANIFACLGTRFKELSNGS